MSYVHICSFLQKSCSCHCGGTRDVSSNKAEGGSCRWNVFVRLLFILGPVVKRPRGVRGCGKDLQGPDCPSPPLLTCALLLSDSSFAGTEKQESWHQLTCHLPSRAAALIATKTDMFLTPNDRGWREEKKNRRSCRLMLGVRPSLLEQASEKLAGNGLLVSGRDSQTLIEEEDEVFIKGGLEEKWKGSFKYLDVLQPISSVWTILFVTCNIQWAFFSSLNWCCHHLQTVTYNKYNQSHFYN